MVWVWEESRKCKDRMLPTIHRRVQVTFGMSVRAYREERELIQEALAELADLHTNYVSSVERGEQKIFLFHITRLAYALKLPVTELTECLDPA